MWIRALCVALVVCVAPASAGAASVCCDAHEASCPDERPSCPTSDRGTCAIASTSDVLATRGTDRVPLAFLLAELPPSPGALAPLHPGHSCGRRIETRFRVEAITPLRN